MKKFILFAILIYIQSELEAFSLSTMIFTAFIVYFLPTFKKLPTSQNNPNDEFCEGDHYKRHYDEFHDGDHYRKDYLEKLYGRPIPPQRQTWAEEYEELRRMRPEWFK